MKGQSYLGIYLRKDVATVVCLGIEGRERKIINSFSVSVADSEQQSPQDLAVLIAKTCADKIPSYRSAEVSVALDCAMFMQHNIHSEFAESKQIGATIRFDTEEALATDISDLALTFQIVSTDPSGSNLSVFTVQKKILSQILTALQSYNIYPVAVEPDVCSLSRFVLNKVSLAEDVHPLFAILSQQSGYFIAPHLTDSQKQMLPMKTRTFIVRPAQNRTDLFARELPLTTALLTTNEPINLIKVFDSTGTVDLQQLDEKIGLKIEGLDLSDATAADSRSLDDAADPVDFAIAFGAALSNSEKQKVVNFRDDFMPFQGKKLRLQKIVKILGIAATILILALGVYVHLPLLEKNDERSQLREKFEKDYLAVMLDEKKLPASFKEAFKKLGSTRRYIENVKKGINPKGEKSISAKLTMVLESFNECAAATNLEIEKITITSKNITIIGSTSSRKNTLKAFEAIKNNLEIITPNYSSKGNRDTFNITVVPKK